MQEPAAEAAAGIEALGGLSASEDQLKSLLQARDELEQRLMPDLAVQTAAVAADEASGVGNIVGVGIGEKEVGGFSTGQLVVKVLVKEKLNPGEVASEALVPQSLGGVATDVDESGEIRAQLFTARRRPAPCGVSIGNCTRIMAGTLGCLVTRAGQLFILSNNHVMALVNTSPLNAGIPQPGRLDGGVCPNDIIARLTQFVPINFAAGAINVVDTAIARTSPALVNRRVLRPGGVLQPFAPPLALPALNMLVQKSGRTTQYRRGIIDLVNTTVNVSYAPLGGVARFARQFRVRGLGGIFSDRGDSGSLVTTLPQNQPVGLLFAGNAASNTTFCNMIQPVLGAFGVTIVF
ncbi:hypothetical protein FHP25_21680 [Vineibacter terrae]|uniref:Trypsin-like peptidase domain-containing protein n=1 Tax=Vineibacter terrae TaxID=2586908 RepID=A0A5C8PHX8_9HYPH|nr:hypothetical protein [Vineibacter terrae]TXL73298.1 hypothetical protein FHP25_21680 [Vineibacter terrae]